MRFAPGEVLLRRYWRGDRISFIKLCRVAADDEFGLRLWLPAGYPFWQLLDADGRSLKESPILARRLWKGSDVMIWMPDQRPYSVWWFWNDGSFLGWYVNLEDPYVRWADRGCAGVDTSDHALDVWVEPDHTWRFKDSDEFQARVGHPLYWTAAQAARIQATGEELTRLAEAARFPFDGTWTGFRPDAGWTVPALPPGADRPRAIIPAPRPGAEHGVRHPPGRTSPG
jgi:hypothetical protein